MHGCRESPEKDYRFLEILDNVKKLYRWRKCFCSNIQMWGDCEATRLSAVVKTRMGDFFFKFSIVDCC